MINRLEIEKQMRALDDPSLRRLVFLQQTDYLPEAVKIARDELARRGMSVLTPETYWEKHKQEWLETIGFCYGCWSETVDESAGQTLTINLIGQRLVGKENPCDVCGSVVQEKYFCIIVPLVRIGSYRVLQGDRGTYIGRRLKSDETSPNRP